MHMWGWFVMGQISTELKKDFLSFLVEVGAAKFGDFTTKSGRKSPYFFNFGTIQSGKDLAKLGQFYVRAFKELGIYESCDIVFGTAYKGIPIATGLVMANQFSNPTRDFSLLYNRKEVKTHGETGVLVGDIPNSTKSICIVDDVLTSGKSLAEAMSVLEHFEYKSVMAMVGLDRRELGFNHSISARQFLMDHYHLRVESIVNIDEVIQFAGEKFAKGDFLERAMEYRKVYGAN